MSVFIVKGMEKTKNIEKRLEFQMFKKVKKYQYLTDISDEWFEKREKQNYFLLSIIGGIFGRTLFILAFVAQSIELLLFSLLFIWLGDLLLFVLCQEYYQNWKKNRISGHKCHDIYD